MSALGEGNVPKSHGPMLFRNKAIEVWVRKENFMSKSFNENFFSTPFAIRIMRLMKNSWRSTINLFESIRKLDEDLIVK